MTTIQIKSTYLNQTLISNNGISPTLLNLAFPPLIASKVSEIFYFWIGPSCSVNLFLFPGFRITTLSDPL